jgi:hypothetical protein
LAGFVKRSWGDFGDQAPFPLLGVTRFIDQLRRKPLPSDIIDDTDLRPLDMDFGKEWGDDSLLDIEKDLEGLDDLGDWGVSGESGLDGLTDLDVELDEWEEFMDSHWSKIMDE